MKIKKSILIILIFLFIVAFLIYPKAITEGAVRGLVISANTIIPTLFPFMVLVLIFLRLKFYIFSPTTTVFVFSLLGGYPIGAKLIEELYNDKKITKKGADLMRCYCVNAGPSFILSVVGIGILGDKILGILLFISHIIASFSVKLILNKKLNGEIKCEKTVSSQKFSDIFSSSITSAADSLINICSYIVFFSGINALLSKLSYLNPLTYFLEVTTAVLNCKNIYLISFLLGFSGFSIIFQILSISKNSKPKFFLFLIFRVIHGTLSAFILRIMMLFVKIDHYVFSILKSAPILNYDKIQIVGALFVFIIVLILSYENKNNCRKKLKDLL